MNITGLSGCINVVKNECWNFIMWPLAKLLGISYEKIYPLGILLGHKIAITMS